VSKIRITAIKPKEAEKRLFKNGFVCLNPKSSGADKFYIKMNGEEKVLDEEGKQIVTMISFHPEDLRPHFVSKMIKRAKKTKEEWVNL
jgi:predicted RNA binding protein YcfA (HicA-like mRNA interferase family)